MTNISLLPLSVVRLCLLAQVVKKVWGRCSAMSAHQQSPVEWGHGTTYPGPWLHRHHCRTGGPMGSNSLYAQWILCKMKNVSTLLSCYSPKYYI